MHNIIGVKIGPLLSLTFKLSGSLVKMRLFDFDYYVVSINNWAGRSTPGA